MSARSQTRVGLIGAGFIARVHLDALARTRGVRVVAVCDPDRRRAERLAAAHGVRHAFSSAEEMLAAGGIDAAHVLTPPGTHFEVAGQCLAAGLHTLVEKPLVLEPEQARTLAQQAAARSLALGVNHNLLFHPGVERLRRHLAAGRIGRLEHLALVHNVPLRQLATGDVGHFMFQTEANILWEQGVHLFSVVERLLGRCRDLQATTGPARELPHGVRFFDQWLIDLVCEGGTAQLDLAFGRSMPEAGLLAIGSDGAVGIDLLRGSWQWRRKTRYLDPVDQAWNGLAAGTAQIAGGLGGLVRYGLSLFGLAASGDPFLASMRASLQAFHRAVREGRPAPCDAGHGASVLELCQRAAEAAGASRAEPERKPLAEPGPVRPGEILVLGGTGYLGRHCVDRLLAAGRPVTLLVRRPGLLPAAWRDGRLRVFSGDAGDSEALAAAMAGVDSVLHLATCAGDDPARAPVVMAEAVGLAARTARQAGVRRLVYASSTAALYLGGRAPVPGSAPPDPLPAARSEYARAKIAAEQALAAGGEGLEVVIARPAIVVGGGNPPEHGGVGLWVREVHCIGWNRGRNPLPLVEVGDCAAALVACLHAPAAAGRSYNLAGRVRLSARAYVAELARRRRRPYRFHPQWPSWFWLRETGKWLIKRLARRPATRPTLRDLRSRGFRAPLQTEDAERDLDWRPEADPAVWMDRVFGPAPAEAPRR